MIDSLSHLLRLFVLHYKFSRVLRKFRLWVTDTLRNVPHNFSKIPLAIPDSFLRISRHSLTFKYTFRNPKNSPRHSLKVGKFYEVPESSPIVEILFLTLIESLRVVLYESPRELSEFLNTFRDVQNFPTTLELWRLHKFPHTTLRISWNSKNSWIILEMSK